MELAKTVEEASFDAEFQRRLSAITSGQQVCQMSHESLQRLTHDFEEKYVRQLICKCREPGDQLRILCELEEAHEYCHTELYGNFYGGAPSYFMDFRIDLELGLCITPDDDVAVALPKSAADPKFEELCKSLIEQRAKFEQVTKGMDAFLVGVKRGDPTYKNLVAQQRDYEKKCKECEELRFKNDLLSMQLDEAQKMNKKLAEKSDAKTIESFIRQYLNQSKKKRTAKREQIKNFIEEMVNSANFVLPDDLKSMLDSYDDETPATVGKLEVYQPGSTKNEGCQQIITPVSAPPQAVPIAANRNANPRRPFGLDDFPDDCPF